MVLLGFIDAWHVEVPELLKSIWDFKEVISHSDYNFGPVGANRKRQFVTSTFHRGYVQSEVQAISKSIGLQINVELWAFTKHFFARELAEVGAQGKNERSNRRLGIFCSLSRN